jgi:hypothetical protein
MVKVPFAPQRQVAPVLSPRSANSVAVPVSAAVHSGDNFAHTANQKEQKNLLFLR